MSLPVILSAEAETDFDEAADWYEQQQSGLGLRFIDCVEKTLSKIGAMPKAHQIRHKDIRRASVAAFHYGVFYRVEPDKVVVTAIVHDRRNPSIWMSRS